MTDKLAGTCSVCLRTMQLHGERPIRHGFSAIGVHHGQHSGYHTGPCDGTRFSHLGISTEGTQWALERARTYLDGTRTELAKLETRPDFTWYPTKYNVAGRPLDLANPVVVKHGVDPGWDTRGVPSYESLYRKRKAELDARESELERAIAAYEKVIATWSPAKYPTTGATAKVETTHMATPRKNSRSETWTGILCRFTKQGSASTLAKKTDDPSKVTCKRCRSALGLPPL